MTHRLPVAGGAAPALAAGARPAVSAGQPRRPRARRRRRGDRAALRDRRAAAARRGGAHRRRRRCASSWRRRCPASCFVSDQLFDIFPLQRFLKFHEFELARAIYESWVARRTLGDGARRRLRLGAGRGGVVSRRPLHAALVSQGGVRARDPGVGQLHPGHRSRHVRAAGAVRLLVLLHARGSRSAARQPGAVRQPAPDGQDDLHQAARSARHAGGGRSDARAARRHRAARRRRRSCAASRSTGSGSSGSGPIRRSTIASPTCTRSALGQARLSRHTRASSRSASTPPVEPVEVRATDCKGNVVNQTWDGVGREHTYVFDTAGAAVGDRDRSARPARREPARRQRRPEVRRPPAAALEVHLQQLRRPLALLPDAGARPVARLLAVAHPRPATRPALRRLSLGVDAGRHHRARTRYGFGQKITAARLSLGVRPLARRGAHRPVVRRRRSAPAPTRARSSPRRRAGATTIGSSCGSR